MNDAMKQDDKLFIIGLTALVLSLFLFPFALYLFPMAWLGWQYTVPSFVIDFTIFLEVLFSISYKMAFIWVMRVLFLLSVICGVTAYYISKRLGADAHVEMKAIQQARSESDLFPQRVKQSSRESVVLFIKLVFFASIVFLVARVMLWAISITT